MRFSFAIAAVLLSSAHIHAAEETFEPVPEARSFSLLVGVGASVQPVYEGSDEYRVAPFPVIAPSFGASDGPRRFEFRGIDDIRIHALYLGPLSFGPLAGYRFGRDESDADLLRGTGDVDGGLVVGGFVNYDFVATDDTRFGAAVAVSGQVTGDVFDDTPFDQGSDFGIETDLSVSFARRLNERLRVSALTGLRFADSDYMRTGFGISAAQSAASAANLAVFDPDSGLKDVYAKVRATYKVTENFELRAGVGYSRLVDDASNSPITTDANQFSANVSAAYRFRF